MYILSKIVLNSLIGFYSLKKEMNIKEVLHILQLIKCKKEQYKMNLRRMIIKFLLTNSIKDL